MRCVWTEDDDGAWDTTCGERFEFVEGGPSDNRMTWCCYCGKPLAPAPHVWDDPDEATP